MRGPWQIPNVIRSGDLSRDEVQELRDEAERLKAHDRELQEEHLRHSLAVKAHSARADQQESRAIHAEKQLRRWAHYIESYEQTAAELEHLRERAERAEAAIRRVRVVLDDDTIELDVSLAAIRHALDCSECQR